MILILSKNVVVSSNMPRKEDMPLAKKYMELQETGRDDEIQYTAMELRHFVCADLKTVLKPMTSA